MGPEFVIEARSLGFSFNRKTVIDSLSFTVCAGSFITFLGPSGCGKTTLLNLIAGIYKPVTGDLQVRTSRISFVFQNDALLSWRTTLGNVLLPFELAGRRIDGELRARAVKVLNDLGLGGCEEYYPSQLSGGMKKRVELARALVTRPSLLLLDEPLSNLDLKLREEMRIEISTLQRRLGIAAMFVTHDQEEALTMSDRIAVMRGGRIEQLGSAKEIYEAPASAFVAGFIGSANLIRGSVAAPRDPGGMMRVDTVAGPAVISGVDRGPDSGAVLLMIRPERLKLTRSGTAPEGANAWPAQVLRTIYLGGRMEVRLRLRDGGTAIAYAVNEGGADWDEGEMVDAWFRPQDAWVISAAAAA